MSNIEPIIVLTRSLEFEKKLLSMPDIDASTKRQITGFFKDARELFRYQIPDYPINVKDEGREFKCPRCGTIFQADDTVEDFWFCGVCGQKFKDNTILLKAVKECDFNEE